MRVWVSIYNKIICLSVLMESENEASVTPGNTEMCL